MADFPLMPIRNQEPPIVERLRLGFPAATFTIERVPQVMTITEFKRISRLSPFLGLAWVGMKPDPDNGRMLKGDMAWRLILVNRVSSGLEARFKGDRREIGMDAMIDVSAVLLHGVSFDGLGRTAVTGANAIVADGYADDDIAVAQVDFTFSFATTPAATGLRTPDDFLSLGITWSLDGSDREEVSEVTPHQEQP